MHRTYLDMLLFIATFSYGQSEIERVYKTIVALDQALVAKDSITLKNLLTDNFIDSVPSGDKFYKSDYINYHCRPGMGLVQLKTQPMDKTNIRFYGNTAIVHRRVEAVRFGRMTKKKT